MDKITELQFINFLQRAKGLKIDSRQVKKGDIFIGLLGEKEDGGFYAKQAIKQGAKIVIVNKKFKQDYQGFKNVYFQDDTFEFLISSAFVWRENFKGKIFAIAGSNGKTTTKNILSHIFKSFYKINSTIENENNKLGTVLTMLRTKMTADFLFAEIGTNHIGELKEIIDILKPNYGIITNLGEEHLEFFGDLEGVAEEELTLACYLKSIKSFIFAPESDLFLMEKLNVLGIKIKPYSLNNLNCPIISINGINYLSDNLSKKLNLVGEHSALNYLASYEIAKNFKIPKIIIEKSILSFKATENRNEIFKDKKLQSTFFFDAYNANPSSMKIAIDTFLKLKTKESKILVLGAMKELGSSSNKSHQEIVEIIRNYPFEKIYLIGEEYKNCNLEKNTDLFGDYSLFINQVRKKDFERKFILVKGSKSSKVGNFRVDYQNLV